MTMGLRTKYRAITIPVNERTDCLAVSHEPVSKLQVCAHCIQSTQPQHSTFPDAHVFVRGVYG